MLHLQYSLLAKALPFVHFNFIFLAPVKRRAHEAAFKLRAIKHAAEHGNRATARKFNVNESMIRNWKKQESVLCQIPKTKLRFRERKAT